MSQYEAEVLGPALVALPLTREPLTSPHSLAQVQVEMFSALTSEAFPGPQ